MRLLFALIVLNGFFAAATESNPAGKESRKPQNDSSVQTTSIGYTHDREVLKIYDSEKKIVCYAVTGGNGGAAISCFPEK